MRSGLRCGSIAALAVLGLMASGCQRDPAAQVYKFERMQMSTQVQISVVALDQATAQAQSDAAFAEIERIEALFSEHLAHSDVSRINALAGDEWVKVDPEVFAMLELARDISAQSDGTFDITFRGMDLWRFDGSQTEPPSDEQIEQRRGLIDYRRLELDPANSAVHFGKPGMAIGLGGIAKGYAVKRAVERLKQSGCTDGIVNAGGDLYAFGDKLGQPWSVGVQHPRHRGELLATIEISDAAVVTSGDYERYYDYKGRRYHHIIDPRTGKPATGCQSVTIITADPEIAQALAKAVFVLGPERGMALAERVGIEVLIVDDQGRPIMSPGAERLGLKLSR